LITTPFISVALRLVGQSTRHALRERAAASDELRDAALAQMAQGRVHRERAQPTRRLRRPIGAIALAALGAHEVRRRAHAHGVVMRARIAHDREARVVRHVQPLVAVDGPRIRAGVTREQRTQLGMRGGPQAERAIDVYPRTG
jgi:hypothetical protein